MNPRSLFDSYITRGAERLKAAYGKMYDVAGMAASLEAIEYFASQVGDDDTVLDCGAGVSSLIFRAMFPRRVVTVEADKNYMRIVQQIVAEHNVPIDESWIIGLRDAPEADCVFYDYVGLQARPKFLPVAWALAKKFLYYDDADDRPHLRDLRAAVYSFAANNGAYISDVREAKDSYGRWGVILRREIYVAGNEGTAKGGDATTDEESGPVALDAGSGPSGEGEHVHPHTVGHMRGASRKERRRLRKG